MLTTVAELDKKKMSNLSKKSLFHRYSSCDSSEITEEELNARTNEALQMLENIPTDNSENMAPETSGTIASSNFTSSSNKTGKKPASLLFRKSFGSYYSSFADEDDTFLSSPDVHGNDVFHDLSSSVVSNLATNGSVMQSRTSSQYSEDQSFSPTTPTLSGSGVGGFSFSRCSSTTSVGGDASVFGSQDDQDKLPKQPSELSRRDKSLCLLAER